MLVRAQINNKIHERLREIDPDWETLQEGMFQDLALSNVTHYLLSCQEVPHDSILYFCLTYLQQHKKLYGVSCSEYIKAYLNNLDTEQLPHDLAWAIALYRQKPLSFTSYDALRIVYACSQRELSQHLQVYIDYMAKQLDQLGCNNRKVPMIVGFPCMLDQHFVDGRMTQTSGRAMSHHAYINFDDMVKGDPNLISHIVVHEMIHTTQNLDTWRHESALLEGVTEHVTSYVTRRVLQGYDLEYQLVHQFIQDPEQMIRISNGSFEADQFANLSSTKSRYALLPRSKSFAHRDMIVPLWDRICASDDPDTYFDWRYPKTEDLLEVMSQVSTYQGLTKNQIHNPLTQGAALLVWAAQVMEESPRRVLRWVTHDKDITRGELKSIAQWKQNQTALAWIDKLQDYSDHFWIQCMLDSIVINLDDYLNQEVATQAVHI